MAARTTKTQRVNHYYLIDAMERLQYDLHSRILIDTRIPADWREIAKRRESPKIRVTMRLDEDVVKFFKSMGPRYGPRMNEVLRAYMHAQLMGLLTGDLTMDRFKEGERSPGRPEWGYAEEMLEGE